MQRVNVVGCSGSGKSTFSKSLAEELGIPYVEMDQIYWGPNWQEPARAAYAEKIRAAVSQSSWVLDGNYSRTTAIKWQRADTVIWLDFPLWLTFYRSLSRAIKRIVDQKELWPGTGNRESLRQLFSRKSIVWWMLKNYYPVRKKYLRLMQQPEYSQLTFVHLRSPKQAQAFLAAANVSHS